MQPGSRDPRSEGVPTSDSGRTLDFFFLSNDLANLGEPSTSWEVPFRPHAAISLTLRQELLLRPLPSLVGVGKAPPAQWKIGDVDVKCDAASLWLGCFAQQVAADLEPGSKGLGRHNPTVIQPRAPAVAPKEWTGAAAAVWRRMASSNLAGGRGAPPPHPNVLKEAGLLRTCPSRAG